MSQNVIHLGLQLRLDDSSRRVVVEGFDRDSPAQNSRLIHKGDVVDQIDGV
jgi:hypothetical protein